MLVISSMRIVLSICLLACAAVAFGQESVVNQTNPASLKWYQLNTKNFRILYPKGFEAQAQRMANTMETIREPEAATIGTLPRRISLILQSQSAISNAFVTVTPRRSEFYSMPSQNYNFIGNNDWLNLLASHEYRHMAQFQHANRGFTKLFYYLTGSNTWAGLSYVAAPQWFWEGDAVATETAFTPSGRGRIPNFNLVFRTNLMEGRTFNYHKQYLGSYKNNIPDYYRLGFNMVSYLRKRTNDSHIWDKVTARSWNVPFIPFRFSSALKKETGLYVKDLYNEMAFDLQKQWKAQQDSLHITPFERVNPRPTRAYTDYLYPQELENGSIVAEKTGIGDISQLVVIQDGKEERIYTQGIVNDAGMMSATNSRIVWNEYRFDPRWQVRTYSAIVGYDASSNTKRVIAPKERYASAAISPDGYQVATVKTGTDYQTSLVVLDYFSGKVLKEFSNPDNDFISMPRWAQDGKNIVALVTNKKGKAIARWNLDQDRPQLLSSFTNENIGHPVPVGHYVLYNSPVSGIDNIYALDLESGKRFQITCSKYGSYNPSVSRDGKTIYYNEQGRDGMDIAKIPFAPASWKPWSLTEQPTAMFGHLIEQEAHPNLINSISDSAYAVRRYHRWKGIINPYAWGASMNTSLTQAYAGITSQDILSTTTVSAGYLYDITERVGAWKATISYQGWYPIIDVSVSQSDRKVNEGNLQIESYKGTYPNYTRTAVTKNLTFNWKEKTMQAGLRIPLNTTTSKYYGNVTFSNYVGVTQVSQFSNTINSARIIPTRTVNDTITNIYFLSDQLSNGNLVYNQFTFSAYRLLKQSKRDINSKWGQTIYLNAYNTPYGGDFVGRLFSFYGVGYFPGFFKHHSLWGYWGYQNSQINNIYYANKAGTAIAENYNYQFRNQIPLPRGGLGVSRFTNFYSMSANYTLPVWYPDIAIGPLLNIQRVRANGFFDYGYGQGGLNSTTLTQTYMSAGIEVKVDVNVMRFLPQLDFGVRYSMGIKPSTSLVEILIGSINF